jgi:hypothetical protein
MAPFRPMILLAFCGVQKYPQLSGEQDTSHPDIADQCQASADKGADHSHFVLA